MANIPLDQRNLPENGLLAARRAAAANGGVMPPPVPVVTTPPAPQMPPPPTLKPNQVVYNPDGSIKTVGPKTPVPTGRTTGGTAPVSTLAPNQVIYNPDGSIASVGGKVPVPTTPPPPTNVRATGGAGSVSTTPPLVNGGNGQVTTTPPAVTPIPAYQLPSLDGSDYVATATGNPAGQPESAGQVVQDNLNGLLSSDSPYIQNARLRGAEAAQGRGLRNSSIAAGASERAAIEAAQPILSEIQSLTRQRENLAFQGEQSQLDRTQQVNNAMLGFEFQRTLQSNAALQQDWLSSQNFTREFNGSLAQVPIANAAALSQMIAQYALENPEVYTPETISGMQNFFTGSLAAILQQYFPSIYGTPQQGGGV